MTKKSRRSPLGAGIWALGRLSRSRAGQSRATETIVYQGARTGFQLAGAVARTFSAARRLLKPVRPATVHEPALFDLTPTDEQALIRESVRRFALERLRPAAADADTRCEAPAPLVSEAAGLGLCSLAVPSELGGAGGERSVVTQALVAEALAQGDMGLAVACLAPAGVAAALAEWGTPEQQSRYLPAFAGDKPPAAAIAVLEPHALFDPFELKTRAARKKGGFVLDGEKALVPCAATAEIFLVAAQAEDGPALFVVEAGTRGLAIEADPGMGLRAAGLGRLTFRRMALPASARLALGEGGYAPFVQRSRLAWCALATGAAQAALDYVIPYVNDRVAFGEPISHRQAVAFMVANIAIELEGMRLLTWRAAARADAGHDFAREVALARRACAEHGMRIGSDAVQLLGGHGFVKEHPVERWYRDLRAVGVMEGGVML